VLRALHLGRPLVEGSMEILAEAALFLAIMGLAWATRSGRQCWKVRFPAIETKKDNEGLRPALCPGRRYE